MWLTNFLGGSDMELKEKIVKTAKVCHVISKVLYLLSIAVTLAFIVLAIVLPNTDAIESMERAEVAVMFSTLALYAFICIGLLWNVEGIFKVIASEHSPFTEGVSHYLKKVAVFVLVLSIVPAILGTIIVRSVCPATELNFPVEVGGIVAGLVLFLIGWFSKYGIELQKKDDETL